jgi:hypothetical protein
MLPAVAILPLGVILFGWYWSLRGELGLLVVGEILELQLFRLLGGFALELVGAGDADRPNRLVAPRLARRATARPGRWGRWLRPTGGLWGGRPGGCRLDRFGPARSATRRRGLPRPLRRPFRNGRFLPGRRTALRRRPPLRGGFAFGARRPLARRRPRPCGGSTGRLPACRFLLPGRRHGGLSRPSAPPFFRFHGHVSTSLSTKVRPCRIIQFRVCRGESGAK